MSPWRIVKSTRSRGLREADERARQGPSTLKRLVFYVFWYRGRVSQGENSGEVTIKIKQLTGWGVLPRKVSRVRVNVIFKNVSFDISGRLCSRIVAYTMVSAGVAVLTKLRLPPSSADTLSQKSRY